MKFSKLFISKEATIIDAFKQMDKINVRLLIVMEKDKFFSVLSIGDLQRAIIGNNPLSSYIDNFLRKDVEVAFDVDDRDVIEKHMIRTKTECMPIIDNENNLVDVIFWEDIVGNKDETNLIISAPVVIMAGGYGKRLQPLTNIIPKPLLPLDKHTISEHIINNFLKVGCKDFYFSLNYKSKMIIEYFETLEKDYNFSYVIEEKPLGTAGSLHLLRNKIFETFFISNCDVLIDDNYDTIYNYHKNFNNELTIIASFKYFSMPYGTLTMGENGRLLEIIEKPEINFLVNSGMYILEPYLFDEIPENKFFHITDLIQKILKRNGRVGVFPVNESAWIDIGGWDKYLSVINRR